MEPIKITSLAELQQEKLRLRGLVKEKEQDLKQHYNTISGQVAPALNLFNTLTGNKLFKSALGSGTDNSGWLNTTLKLVTAVSAGGFLFKRSKKNLFKTVLAYAMDQGVKYLQEKDISEHIERIKEWLNKSGDVEEEEEKGEE
ncbi:MAG: hypothetical protein IPL12_18990 [Bacteroidetes bacterium]|nr:hypothetical protein [Bacteroidota bacterium]MBK8345179.1 hypothetical protein [Bacteroidota bacterium]